MITVETDTEPVERIDLHNFDAPRFENSRYVLTSPRSLEACSRLNVKPVELLYKPLTEFQEELLPQDIPLRTIYNIYDEQEQIRLRKLQLCREERGRISKEEVKNLMVYNKKTSSGDAGNNVTKASLQRQRTALATALGHKHVTKDKLNQRAEEQQEESAKLRQELISREERRPKNHTNAMRRPRSAGGTPRGEKKTVRVRSQSVSEIYNKLPPRDRKILDLMQLKREKENQRLEESKRTRLLWEDEKKRQEALRTVMENKRRKLLAHKNHDKSIEKLRESRREWQMEEEAKEQKDEALVLRSKLQDEAFYRQLKAQELKQSEKEDKHRLRKSIQECNLQLQVQDEESMKNQIADLTRSAVTKAQQRREMRFFRESLRRSCNNREDRLAFEQQRRDVEKDAKMQEQGILSLIELRHSQAEENLANLLETRNQQLLASHEEEERKLAKARQTQQKLEEEMEAWKKRMLKHKKQVERQAEITAQVNKDWRAERARQERLVHQEEQRKNLEKIAKEHKKWKQSLEKSLQHKERKIAELQQQKDSDISQMRSQAQMSQMLRDKIRLKYKNDTFDRKVLDAELCAKLENLPFTRSLAKAS